MLTQLRLKNFRLLRDVTVDFNELTVFVGPNSCGKSTVLEVLDFLSRCANDSLESAITAHGGFASVRTVGATTPVEIGSTWTFALDDRAGRKWVLEWNMTLDSSPSGRVVVLNETLVDVADGNVRTIVSTDAKGQRNVFPESSQGGKPSAVKSSQVLAFEAVKDSDRYPSLGHLNNLAGEIRVLGSLTAPPAWARNNETTASPRDSLVVGVESFLARQGVGLANVLYNLSTNHRVEWNELERALRGEFPFVQRIVFPADPGGSKISFALEDERFPERKIYASEMSDGMVAFLSLLAAILQPEQVAVLGLDEPDANFHPSALRRLLALAQRHHSRRRIAIVTHSNALLDHLVRPAADIRVVDPTKGGATIRALDAEALDAWRKEYSLSELRSTGLIDHPNGAYEEGQPPVVPQPEKASEVDSGAQPSSVGKPKPRAG